jgi:hypothetical protein
MGWFSGSSPKVKAYPAWSSEQQGLSSQLSGYMSANMGATQTYPNIGKITEQYPVEKNAMGLLESILSGKDPYGAQNQLKNIIAGQPVENLLQPERAKNYMSATVIGPIMQRLQEELLPAIQASAGKGGTYFSTMRGVEENKARTQAGQDISSAEQQFEYQQLQQQIALEEAQRNRQLSATEVGLNYPLSEVATAMQTGAQARAPQMTAWQDWLMAQQRQQEMVSQIQAYLKQQPYQYVTTPGEKGMGSSLMSLAALALL